MRTTLAASLALLLSACGGGDSDQPPDGGATPDGGDAPYLQYCVDIAAALCDGTEVCACPEVDSELACPERLQRQCERASTAFIGMVALGYADYDAGKLTECAAAIDAFGQTCAAPSGRNQPAACLEVFTDRAGLGDLCGPASQGLGCAGGDGACAVPAGELLLRCLPLPGDGAPCATGRCADGLACRSGTCGALLADGASCGVDEQCEAALVCGVDGTCGAPAADGGACGEDADCAAGLSCEGGECAPAPALGSACATIDASACGAERACWATGGPSSCAARAGDGEACIAFDDCAAGLACDYALASPVCRPLPGDLEPCVSGQCAAGLACDGMTCIAPLVLDAPCGPFTAVPCAAGLGCDSATNTCRPAGAVGEACVGGACAAGLACDFGLGTGTCRSPTGVDTICGFNDALCIAGTYCDGASQRCAERGGVGAPCTDDRGCVDGAACADGLCAALPDAVGEVCDGRCAGALRCGPPPGECVAAGCALRQ